MAARRRRASQEKTKVVSRFVANPTQRLFIEHRPFEGYKRPEDWDPLTKPQVVDLFSCRMGEGKSAALCWATYFFTKHNKGARCALIRDTWENMRDTTMVEFFKWFPEGVAGDFISSQKIFHWNPEIGLEGSVTFMGMDDEKDAAKLQSREFGMFGMDEPSPAAGTGGISEMVFTTALTRLRQPGMHWYAAKLAQNNPDEAHWTYRRFVDPGTSGYTHYQTNKPENLSNLPPGYYREMAKDLEGRPDLQRRFVEGTYGFQQVGRAVTPAWSDAIHLAEGLEPVSGGEVWLSWDGGHTPVCVIGQVTPSGVLLVLDALDILAEGGGGTYQLIEDKVLPLLEARYMRFRGSWSHTGDPTLVTGDQSDTRQSPVLRIKKLLGGAWKPGPKDIAPRVNPLNRRLSLQQGGKGLVVVDKHRAKGVHHALRGGWHYAEHPGGVISDSPVKNHPDSDYGDAVGYLVATLYPEGTVRSRRASSLRGSPGARYNASLTGMGERSLRTDRQRRVRLPKEFREV